MHERHLLAGALTAALLVSALPSLASAQDEETSYEAEGVMWTLDTLAGVGVPEGVEVTLLLAGGEASGSAGCNSYSGGYEIEATSLSFPDPFGVTAMFCEGPAQETEDAYLPLLQMAEGWSVADGMLTLTDAEGGVTLVYDQPPVEITATDLEALSAELESLQTQIDEASAEVAELAESAASVNVNKIRNRIATNEEDIAALEEKTKGLNVANLKKRISAVEDAGVALDKQMTNVKKRVQALEENDAAQDARLDALEALIPVPEQPLP